MLMTGPVADEQQRLSVLCVSFLVAVLYGTRWTAMDGVVETRWWHRLPVTLTGHAVCKLHSTTRTLPRSSKTRADGIGV